MPDPSFLPIVMTVFIINTLSTFALLLFLVFQSSRSFVATQTTDYLLLFLVLKFHGRNALATLGYPCNISHN